MRCRQVAFLVMGLGLAQPAWGYPTALISVPTGELLPAGSLDISQDVYTPWYQELNVCYNTGVFDGFAWGDTRIGGLEIGFDAIRPGDGNDFSISGKLGLCSETEVLPSLGIGTHYLGTSTKTYATSPNFLFISGSKSVSLRDLDLGQYTFGGYHASPVIGADNNGFMLGYKRALPNNLALWLDYTSGMNPFGGLNVSLAYSPFEGFTANAGYFFSNERGNGKGDRPVFLLAYTKTFTGK